MSVSVMVLPWDSNDEKTHSAYLTLFLLLLYGTGRSADNKLLEFTSTDISKAGKTSWVKSYFFIDICLLMLPRNPSQEILAIPLHIVVTWIEWRDEVRTCFVLFSWQVFFWSCVLISRIMIRRCWVFFSFLWVVFSGSNNWVPWLMSFIWLFLIVFFW